MKGYAKLPDEEKQNDRVMNAYAHARFLALEPMWKCYTDIKFNKVATFKKDLPTKQKKIPEVEKAYNEVLAIGAGEYGIAALTRIGLAYARLGGEHHRVAGSEGPRRGSARHVPRRAREPGLPAGGEGHRGAGEGARPRPTSCRSTTSGRSMAQDKINKYRPGFYAKVREVPFRGSEFFVTAPVVKEVGVAKAGRCRRSRRRPPPRRPNRRRRAAAAGAAATPRASRERRQRIHRGSP